MGQGKRIKVGGSRSRSGAKVGGGVKVGGQGQGRSQTLGGSRLLSRSGVKIEGGVMVGGQCLGRVKVWVSRLWSRQGVKAVGLGQGYDRWSQSRGQCRGSKSGVSVRGSMSGGGVMVRGMRVKVWGVWVRWSVWFIVGGGCR